MRTQTQRENGNVQITKIRENKVKTTVKIPLQMPSSVLLSRRLMSFLGCTEAMTKLIYLLRSPNNQSHLKSMP